MIRLIDLLKEAVLIDRIPATHTLQESLPHIAKLGNNTLLTRESSGIKSGAALLSSEDYTKGRISSILSRGSAGYNPNIAHKFKDVLAKFNMKHIVYCSHGRPRFMLGGSQYFMVPVGEYKTVWSPEVKDIYAVLSGLDKTDNTDKFPIESYVERWPTGDVNEVLVDCQKYYLITTRTPIIAQYLRRNKIAAPTTYAELHHIVEKAIRPYI